MGDSHGVGLEREDGARVFAHGERGGGTDAAQPLIEVADLVKQDRDTLWLGQGGIDSDLVVFDPEGAERLGGIVRGADAGTRGVERGEEVVEGGQGRADRRDVGGERLSGGVVGVVEADSGLGPGGEEKRGQECEGQFLHVASSQLAVRGRLEGGGA